LFFFQYRDIVILTFDDIYFTVSITQNTQEKFLDKIHSFSVKSSLHIPIVYQTGEHIT